MTSAPLMRRYDALPGETIGQKFWNAREAARFDRSRCARRNWGSGRSDLGRATVADARRSAMGLAALGFEPGHTASILSNTRQVNGPAPTTRILLRRRRVLGHLSDRPATSRSSTWSATREVRSCSSRMTSNWTRRCPFVTACPA
jgi:hypothetical protein